MTSTLIKAESALGKSEQELSEAMQAAFESFYSQGVILERILMDREFKDAGFESFDEYLNKRQPLGIKRAYAWKLIAAKRVRMLLPDVDSTSVESGFWTESAIRPLTHSDFNPNDQKRIGKKVAAAVARGEKLTASLVKSICDDERGVERRAAEKQYQEVTETPTPRSIIYEKHIDVQMWLNGFNDVPVEFWSDAESEDAGCVKRLSEKCSELAAFLATKKPR